MHLLSNYLPREERFALGDVMVDEVYSYLKDHPDASLPNKIDSSAAAIANKVANNYAFAPGYELNKITIEASDVWFAALYKVLATGVDADNIQKLDKDLGGLEDRVVSFVRRGGKDLGRFNINQSITKIAVEYGGGEDFAGHFNISDPAFNNWLESQGIDRASLSTTDLQALKDLAAAADAAGDAARAIAEESITP